MNEKSMLVSLSFDRSCFALMHPHQKKLLVCEHEAGVEHRHGCRGAVYAGERGKKGVQKEQDKTISSCFFYRTDFILRPVPKT